MTGHPPPGYRVAQVSRTSGHRYTCDPCGDLPAGPNAQAAKERARRHAAAHPHHAVSMTHTVTTVFLTRPRTN